MARTDWTSPHSELEGLSEEGKQKGRQITGSENPKLHLVLKQSWREASETESASSFAQSEIAHLLFPGISPRSIDTRIGKVIKAEIESETALHTHINLFAAHDCVADRTHTAIQKGRKYREPILVRISVRKSPPYGRVEVGDQVFLKASGGPILRKSTVNSVDSFDDADERMVEIRELTKGTALYDDEEYWDQVSQPTLNGRYRRYATVMRMEEWEDLDHRVIVHPPKGTGASWIVIRGERQIERYLVGEMQLPKREKQRTKILKKHEKQEDGR